MASPVVRCASSVHKFENTRMVDQIKSIKLMFYTSLLIEQPYKVKWQLSY